MTEDMKNKCELLLSRINDVQTRAWSDHSPGAGMVRGPFGEYVLLSAVQDMLKAVLLIDPKDGKGQMLEDLLAQQRQLNRAISSLQNIDTKFWDAWGEISRLRIEMGAFNDRKNA